MSTKFIVMHILLLLLFSFSFGTSSYGGLLLPNSTTSLISYNQDYIVGKNILLDVKSINKISSHYISFPNTITVGVFDYQYKTKLYKINSSISIINYGDFEDSESYYTFSSNDYILKNSFLKDLNKNIYASFDLKYLYSEIDIYTSSTLLTKFSLFYHHQRFLLQLFVDNYGFILNDYTTYNDKTPVSFGYNFIFTPKYINSIISINYNIYEDYDVFNVSSELFLMKNSSVMFGFSSLSKDLYYGEFYNDFLTGLSFSFNSKYKNYSINLGFKNLGAVGTSTSFTIQKSLN